MSADFGPSGSSLGFPYAPAQGGGGGAVALAGDVTGTTAASVVSELQGEVLTVTGPIAAGEVIASDAGGTAIVNADIATVLGYDPAANLGALGIPDPTGAPDGQVVTTTGGVYTLAPSGPALSSATPQPLGTATAGVSTEASRADHVHALPTGFVAGATTAEDMTGTGWTTTAGTGVTATWASSKLTISAASGSSAFTSVLSDTTRLGPSSSQWDVCARIDMMAGDGASPAAQVQLGFRVNSSNYFVVVYKTDDRTVGVFSNAAGSFVDSGFVAGPSSGQATGGDLWLRMTRLADGRIAAWWGVGTAGALPTAWTRTHLIDRAALTLAVPSSACTYIGMGWFGLGALSTTTTVDVLAIRTTWQGSL